MTHLLDKTLFIGIGAQKTGTTWIADYLSGHNEVYFSPIKELHYFNAKFLNKSFDNIFVKKLHRAVEGINGRNNKLKIQNALLYLERLDMDKDEDYLHFFDKSIKNEKLFGEITPAYSMLDAKGFQAINNIHPDVKFIFGMRNPVDRFWSHLRYARKFRNNFDPIENFEKMIQNKDFLLRTDYKRTITELEKVVSKENIFYYFYEDLFGDKGGEIVQSLCNFLEIDYKEADFEKNINVSTPLSLDPELMRKALIHFQDIIDFIDDHFQGNIPNSWKSISEGSYLDEY